MKITNKIKGWFQTKVSKISSVLAVSTFGGVVWPEAKYDVYAKETYLRNIIAFRCILKIAEAVSSVPWKVFQDNEYNRQEIKNHPIMNLIRRASPSDSWAYVILRSIAFLVMSGNVFIERVRIESGPDNGTIKEIYSLRPDRMTILINETTGLIKGYRYTVGVKSTTWDVNPDGTCDILHLKLFHPLDDWYGAAITETARYEIDTSNAETEWNKKLLDNECRPGMIFRYKGNLSESQFDRLEKQLNDKFAGSKNTGKNMILEGDEMPDAKPYGFSPTEMDFLEGGREKARRIALAFGIPPQLLGIPGDSTFNNYREARLTFWEDTIFFYLNLVKGELNNWFFGENKEKYLLDYILDDIPALAPKREALWDKLQNANFLSINEKRKMSGMDEVDGGDVILVPATMMPLDMAGTTVQQQDQTQGKQDDEIIRRLISTGMIREEAEELIGFSQDGNGKSKIANS